MKKLLLLSILLSGGFAFGQYKVDLGFGLGGSNYLGDIGGKELTRRDFVWDMHLNQTRLNPHIYGRYRFSKRFSALGNFSYIPLRDFDNETTNPARRARNLNFRNRLWELGARGEFTIYYDNDVGGRGYYNPDFKLYAFAGVAVFRSNPQGRILHADDPTLISNTWHNLREWTTEGQDKPYSRYGLALPAGIGLYFTWNKQWRLGWEFNWRTTFTDYLDDLSTVYADPDKLPNDLARAFASQSNTALINAINDPASGSVWDHKYRPGADTKRGDPTNNDSYLTTSVTLGYVLRGRSSFYRKQYSWLKKGIGRKSRAKF
jgi:hypothetical protein